VTLETHSCPLNFKPIEWPQVGGGGELGLEITEDELFTKMHAWDLENYIVGASSKLTTAEDAASGMVRNHCYAVIEAHRRHRLVQGPESVGPRRN
jgi:hypothetical protein